MSKFAEQLAPLLVDEWPSSVVSDHGGQVVATNCDDGFGAVTGWSVGHVEVNEAAPTVYTATATVTIRGVPYRQVVYVWWYATCAKGERAARATSRRARQGAEKERERAAPMRGVRITLGRDGFPVVWELLGGDSATERLFVSRSMELAAAEAFGRPLPGRRYCVERSIEQAPTTAVVRILEDGPVPMGPYVYLQAGDHTVTTLLCRCSPAQVDRFVQERFYDLRLLKALGPLGHRWLESPPDLAELLRWPDGI